MPLTVNTNLSSLIAQASLKQSTGGLNRAVERMTTGFKINGAKDNAANYSISTKMSAKISAYQVAEDNAAQGLDLLMTANDSLSLMSKQFARIRDLTMQAQNDTYGNSSKDAINAEINARLDEVERLYSSTEFNGINLFLDKRIIDYIIEVEEIRTEGLIGFDEVDETQKLTEGTYAISTAKELAKLASMTNAGLIGADTEFVLANDIDLSGYSSGEGWTPIGNTVNLFAAKFNGNGHIITNLYINRPDENYQGLFGYTDTGSEITNLGLKNVNITGGTFTGGLAGRARSDISNCYASGKIEGFNDVGMLVGYTYNNITNCHTSGSVKGNDAVGGLLGTPNGALIENCFSTCSAEGIRFIGGLIGDPYKTTVRNCYATGNVKSEKESGGLAGICGPNSIIENCMASGKVVGDSQIGGLIGGINQNSVVRNCYATGNVIATGFQVGGLMGTISDSSISNCYALGNVESGGDSAGGFLGNLGVNSSISKCYATGDVKGNNSVGGLIGVSYGTVADCFSTGKVEGKEYTGGLLGYCDAGAKSVKNCYSTGNVIGTNGAGGFAGFLAGTITNCYSIGNIEGNQRLGGFAGYSVNAVLNKCISTGVVNASTSTSIDDFIGSKGGNIMISADSGAKPKGTPAPFVFTPKANGFLESTSNIGTGAGSHNTTENIKISELITIVHKTPVYDTNINTDIIFQVGINSSAESQISINTSFALDNIEELRNIGKNEVNYLETIDNILASISAKQTEYGSCQNRLESVLEEINVQYENLISSNSTIRDADISKESSMYISSQILQQASAALLAAANQTPSIALQLL